MSRKAILLSVVVFLIAGLKASGQQSQRTLVGRWMISSAPINNEIVSRKGNSLGFPDRDMTFEQRGDIRTCFVSREDIGRNVKPLGVWRISGDRFSATFQLWCPDDNQTCGSVVMRGVFVDDDKVKGTMTVFWDEEDETRPTGYDTWTFSFSGRRISGGGS
jgi:hypothetical protein